MSKMKDISSDAIELAYRRINGDVNDVQFHYIIKAKNINPEEVVAAVKAIEGAKTSLLIWRCVHTFAFVVIFVELLKMML